MKIIFAIFIAMAIAAPAPEPEPEANPDYYSGLYGSYWPSASYYYPGFRSYYPQNYGFNYGYGYQSPFIFK